MRQGDGADLLGANDPRRATIGIIYVAPHDERLAVLTAISTQVRLGRKQVVLVLPEEDNEAFQTPVDFDGLKNFRRDLKIEIVVIAPSRSGPAELARLRRFPVYSSLESYARSLQNQPQPQAVPAKKGRGWAFWRKPEPTTLPASQTIDETGSSTGSADIPLIYVGPEEDLTNVSERLAQTPAQRITLVIPSQAKLHSHVTWRVLFSRTRKMGKDVLVISSDRQIRSMAKEAGFLVADSIGSPPTHRDRLGLGRTRLRGSAPPAPPDYPAKIAEPMVQEFGNYRLIRLLGEGELSSTYLGKHIRFNSQVAIKVLTLCDQVEGFLKEVSDISHLQHPHIVRVLEPGLEGNTPYLVMDYAPNGNLRQRHPNGLQLPLATIMDYVKQIAGALQYIHDQKRIHRGIRPENMLLGLDNNILLSDLIIARDWYSDTILLSNKVKVILELKYSYTAPEYHNNQLCPASDQYSLGVVVYEWLCGVLPFQGSFAELYRQHLNVLPPPLHKKIPSIPSAVERVVMKALAKDPKQRFASVQEFAEALEEAYLSSIKPKKTDRVGERFGNYRLIRLLERDNVSEVYLGEHTQFKTYFAIKVINEWLADAKKEQFLKEMSLIAQLVHPYIVQVRDFGVQDHTPFLVTDYTADGNLRQRHPKGVQLPLITIVDYIKQIASALQYAHDQKIVHRNVRPEKMFLGQNNSTLLGGFEAFVPVDPERDLPNLPPELLYYIAPEQIQGFTRFACDQYSLGVVVYEWLCGEPPFKGSNFLEIAIQHMETPPPPLHKKVPSISPAVEGVILTALSKEPQHRFPNVQAFAAALEQASRPKRSSTLVDRTGQQFGDYRLIQFMGEGTFGDVYLGEHVHDKTRAAVKVLKIQLTNANEIREFINEARSLFRLQHSHIVKLLDFSIAFGDVPFLVTEYAPHGTLLQRHPRGVTLPVSTIASYVKQVADALQYAHDRRLIHRDVKPQNMLLGPNNEVLLGDFGTAVVAHSTQSQRTEDIVGTWIYSAPEQFQGKPRPASDQYALAVVTYEWLCGALPFQGSFAELYGQHVNVPPPPFKKDLKIPPAIEQVAMTALAKDSHQRFASVKAFANALEQASQQQR